MICLEIKLPHNGSFLVTTWYRPPGSSIDLFDDYANFLGKCDYENKQLIILGDMNCDYSKNLPESHTQKLQFISCTYQLEQLILEPTRVTNTSATLIDLLFTNDTRNIAQSGVIHIGLSDHSLIYAVRKFSIPKRRQVIKQVRNLKHFSEKDFISDLQNIPWYEIESLKDPNLAWKKWEYNFNQVLNRHAPFTYKRTRSFSLPWLNSSIKKNMYVRDYHKKQFIKHKSQYHWKLYQTARNKINIEIRKSKSKYYQQKIEECEKTNPKATWRLINSLTGTSYKSNYVTEIELDNGSVVSGSDLSEAFNDYFINIGPKLAAESTSNSTNDVDKYLKISKLNLPFFNFGNLSTENVLSTLKHLQTSKSTGLDNIPAKMLKIAAHVLAPSLTYIFNVSLSTGIFVDDWKDARVNPIYKEGSRRNIGNYRPISILPIISKVFEKEVFRQLYEYFNENSLLSKFQSGFRPGYSTLSALIQMCDSWFENMDNGKLTGVVFLDIRKAFDSIDHEILLKKLKFYGVVGTEYDWFQSYLTNRYQQTFLNGFLSKKKKIICGIPQGSILGPLLFLIYINDLPNYLESTVPCLYADDTQVFASSQDTSELADKLNSDLVNIMDWLTVNKLQSHAKKTKFMLVGSAYNLSISNDVTSSIMINNNIIESVRSQKCLGVDLDNRLAFDIYIENICRKICSGIGVIRRIKPFVPLRSLRMLYKALIQPYFDYCSPLWDTCGKVLKDKLQVVQNRAARILTGARFDTNSADVLESLQWTTLDVRRDRLKSVLLYKILNEQSAPSLRQAFVKNKDLNRDYDLRSNDNDLALPKPKTNFLKRSFRYSAAKLWNSLPSEVKEASSLYQFKRSMSTMLRA